MEVGQSATKDKNPSTAPAPSYVPGESRIPLFKKQPHPPTLICPKPAKIPGAEGEPSKLAKPRSQLLKENSTAQHASADQSAVKRTRYTTAAGASKTSLLKAPKELKPTSSATCISRALSNETINISKESRKAPTKNVHKSTETLSLLKRAHFVRAISNEEHQSQGTALPQTNLKENLVHAVSKDAPQKKIQRLTSKKVHASSESLNVLKGPHFTRAVSTEEPHVLTAPGVQSSTKAGLANDTSVLVEHMPSPHISSQTSCVLSGETLHEKLSPVTTILACSAKSEVAPNSPPNNSGKQGFFKQLLDSAKSSVASILTFSPPQSPLQSPRLQVPCSPTMTSFLLPTRDTNKSSFFSDNTTELMNVDYDSLLNDEVILIKHFEETIPKLLAKKKTCANAPHFTTDSQRPNLLSLENACFTDQQQINRAVMLSTKWSEDHEKLVTSERDKLEIVTFNHIGQRVIVSGKKVGILKYFGGIEFESGNWCGIELDEPAGLNDGSIKGVRYFSCKPSHGILAPQSKVQLCRYVKPKQQFCDMLPILSEPLPQIPLRTKNSSASTDNFEKSQLESTATPSTTANSNQVWETNGGSPKPAQQVNISKQNSFELDESLGILTPDQLPDQLVSLSTSVDSFLLQQTFPESVPQILKDSIETDVLCESDGSEDLLSRAVLSKSDPKNVDVSDRTLSPEELPMDPPAPLGSDEVKEVRSPGPSSRSQPPTTCFVTSITSIGSLDTDGYQGDGELSRPASRNNCTSPTGLLPHKACVLKMKTSTQDPMTDSDFFTESDADDLAGPGRGGDRHAQVIDGTLYNNASNGGCLNQQHQPCPSFTASINEEMESSGVYSDLERKPEEKNNDEKPGNVAFSPDVSTNTESTKSEPSQVKDPVGYTSVSPNRAENPLEITLSEMNARNTQITEELEEDHMEVVHEDDIKEFDGTPRIISNISSHSINDSKSSKKSIELKKYKMPKRNVVSKIKAMIEASPTNRGGNASTEEENLENCGRGSTPKAARKGRWDAVMSKIAQGQADEKMKPARLKEVKSKVFATLTESPPSTVTSAKRKLPGPSTSAKKENQTPLKTKSRRSRTRASSSSSLPPGTQAPPDSVAGASPNSSQRSSLSDLAATPTPKPPSRSSKKVLPPRSTSPSPASDLSAHSGQPRGHPTPAHVVARVAAEMKTPPARKPASRRGEKHKILRDHNRLAACVSPKPPPPVEPPPAPHVVPAESPELRHATKSVQALAIMVQYLVHEVDAFSTPHVKARLTQMTAAWRAAAQERDELVVGNTRLQEDLHKANYSFQQQLEEIRRRHQEELNKVVVNCEEELSQRATSHAAQLEAAIEEHRVACEQLRVDHELLLASNRASLQQEHQAAMKQLQADSDERLARLQQKYNTLESDNLKGQNQYRSMLESMKLDKDSRLQTTASQCKELTDEVSSLQAVLAIRLVELQDMRVKNLILKREQEDHQAEINRNSSLLARIEDLEAQLEVKTDSERRLTRANHRLSESFQHESFNAKRLSQHNEELTWKLKTQSEICNQLASGNSSGIDMPLKTLIGNCNTRIDFCSENASDKPTYCSAGDSPLHKTSYLERSDSVAWTFDMEDAGKKVARTGGAVRRIRSFHDTNSSGFRDFATSPRHNQSATVGEKRRSTVDSENYFSEWPVATSTPRRADLNEQMGQNADSQNPIEIDQNEPLIVVETLLSEKGSCSNLAVQVPAVPKEAAGEAMISEETSEEEDSSDQHLTDEESSSEVMLS